MFKTGDKIKFRGTLNKARGAKDNRGIIEGIITHIPENKEWLRVSHSSGPDSIVYPADVVAFCRPSSLDGWAYYVGLGGEEYQINEFKLYRKGGWVK